MLNRYARTLFTAIFTPTARFLLRLGVSPDAVTLEMDGLATTFAVAVTAGAVDVDSVLGHVRLAPVPRFTDPADAVASGSLLAPMPGTVVKVAVTDGEDVAAGDVVHVRPA